MIASRNVHGTHESVFGDFFKDLSDFLNSFLRVRNWALSWRSFHPPFWGFLVSLKSLRYYFPILSILWNLDQWLKIYSNGNLGGSNWNFSKMIFFPLCAMNFQQTRDDPTNQLELGCRETHIVSLSVHFQDHFCTMCDTFVCKVSALKELSWNKKTSSNKYLGLPSLIGRSRRHHL